MFQPQTYFVASPYARNHALRGFLGEHFESFFRLQVSTFSFGQCDWSLPWCRGVGRFARHYGSPCMGVSSTSCFAGPMPSLAVVQQAFDRTSTAPLSPSSLR